MKKLHFAEVVNGKVMGRQLKDGRTLVIAICSMLQEREQLTDDPMAVTCFRCRRRMKEWAR